MDFIHIILFFPNNRWKFKIILSHDRHGVRQKLAEVGKVYFFIVKFLLKAYFKNVLRKKYLYRLSIFHSNFVFHLVKTVTPCNIPITREKSLTALGNLFLYSLRYFLFQVKVNFSYAKK